MHAPFIEKKEALKSWVRVHGMMAIHCYIELGAPICKYGFYSFPQQATIECQRVSQTVGGLPTDPTTKEPQLGMIGQEGDM